MLLATPPTIAMPRSKSPAFLVDSPQRNRTHPGERREQFFQLFEAMVDELGPNSALEWLLCIDLAWNMWDIERYRLWKNAIVVVNQRRAVEEALRLTHPHFGMIAPTVAIRTTIRKSLDAAAVTARVTKRSVSAPDGRIRRRGAECDRVPRSSTVPCDHRKVLASAVDQFNKTSREAAVRREFKLRAKKIETVEGLLEISQAQTKPVETK